MRKIFMKIKNRIRRFLNPTFEEGLRQYGIGEDMRCSSEELEKLKQKLADYEKRLEK